MKSRTRSISSTTSLLSRLICFSELKETAAPGFAALTDDQRAEINDVSAMLTSNLEKITEHGKRADRIVKAMLEHSRGSRANGAWSI